MKNLRLSFLAVAAAVLLGLNVTAQETPPAPSAPRPVTVPAVKEKKLTNGLTVAVVEKPTVPLVTVNFVVKAGAANESAEKAGLADITASMLTKGTKTRSATEIAEAVEFLGGRINSGAGWTSSFVSITVTSDKLDQAIAILSDVLLNPKFDQKELDLLKTQSLDALTYNLKQPSFLASYAASKYSLNEHPADGTPASISSITRSDVESYYAANYRPEVSVLIFAGDTTLSKASAAAEKYFGSIKKMQGQADVGAKKVAAGGSSSDSPVKRILVVDLPKSGQAAVNYYRLNTEQGRRSSAYYPAIVLNSVLGGGYSSRLNLEIRIKRGLSYGAGSGFSWRGDTVNFTTRAQTKNESAAQVAELMMAEIERLKKDPVGSDELVPRKSVLTGNFGRNLETTAGLAGALAELYVFGVPTDELNAYVGSVNAITDGQIRYIASRSILGGDIVIAGDYAMFKDDLAKRFPNTRIEVIKAADLDLSKESLQK